MLRAALFAHGRGGACDGALVAQAESGAAADDPAWRSAHRFLADTPEPKLPFSGAELIGRGLHAGPAMGRVLKNLQARWIRAGFPHEPTDIARLVDEALAAVGRKDV